jgi:hypothetical protein
LKAPDLLLEYVRSALKAAWSIETSSKGLPDNPAPGQCGVTALVVQALLGGDILKTRTGDAWHFYNRIGGKRMDFSEGQFSSPVVYSDFPADRKEVLAETGVLAAVIVAVEAAVIGGHVVLASRARKFLRSPRAVRRVNRAAGGVGAGVAVVASRS